MIVSGPCSARGERSLMIAVPVRWLGYDTALVQWSARGGSPGSIFPGRFVHELRWDCNGIPDCNGIVRIVCIVCWIGCAFNCCWEFVIGCTVSYVVIRNVRFLVLSQD